MGKMKGVGTRGSVFATESESSEGELGAKMSSGRARTGETAGGASEREEEETEVGEGRGGEGWSEPR